MPRYLIPSLVALAAAALCFGACRGSAGPTSSSSPSASATTATAATGAGARASSAEPSSGVEPTGSAAPASPPAAASSERAAPKYGPSAILPRRAEKLLFPKAVPTAAAACYGDASVRVSASGVIRCLLKLRYAADPKALESALALFNEAGYLAGLEPARQMDGGWRGQLQLVPELPVGRHRRHLDWLLAATRDFEGFFTPLQTHSDTPFRYAWQPLELKFFRSVGRTTPSAYANKWAMAWNVQGSLHGSAEAVRETLFHEIFHFNDSAHGDWSDDALTTIVDGILQRCTTGKRRSTACLRPYAPNHTMVRGGTYYAFQPGNGVWEYAAELAVRYYQEQRTLLAGKKLKKPAFKCGPPENAQTWKLLIDEFFSGVDLVPAC